MSGTMKVFLALRPIEETELNVRHSPLTIVDVCGEWRTFVGGGGGAF